MGFGALPSVLVLGTTLLPLYLLTKCLYNLLLHPLRHHPGPLLNSLSPLPRLLLTLRGTEPQTLHRLHLHYGPVVRLAPNELSFIDAKAWKDIYGFKSKNGKDWTMYALSENTKKSVILAGEGEHQRQRRMLAPAFGERALRLQRGMLTEYTGMMVERLGEACVENRTVDMAKVFNCVT